MSENFDSSILTTIILMIISLAILFEGIPQGTKEERIERMKASVADLEESRPGKNMVYCHFAANVAKKEIEKLERELEEEKGFEAKGSR